jgi:hypothetical protein
MAGLASVGFFAVMLPLLVSLLAFEPFQLSDRYLTDYTALMSRISEEGEDKVSTSIGAVEVYRTVSFKVPLLSFNASNTGAEALKGEDLAYMDLLIIYDLKTGGTDQAPILEKRTMWVRYDDGCASGATCWRLNQTYNDVIDPVDSGNSTGALSKGEMVKITVRFTDQDQPYFNGALGKGAFFFYLNPKDGDSGAKAVTDPKEVQI